MSARRDPLVTPQNAPMVAIDDRLQPPLGTLCWTIGLGVATGGAVIVGIRAATDRLWRTGLAWSPGSDD